MNDYQQLGQPLIQEQIDLNNAANSAAQFFNKTNALGHAPTAQQVAVPHQLVNPDTGAKGQQGFDSEAHRSFMRGLG